MVEDIAKSDLIRRIVDGSLGELVHWQRPVSLPSVGLAFPEVYGRFEHELSQWRTETEERLALWSIRELGEIPPQSEAPNLNPLYDEQGRLGSVAIALRRLKACVPQDFVGGWAVAGKEIDLPYWTSFTTVSLDDLVFLSLGREPRKANFLAACETYGRSDEGDALLYLLEDRLELIANVMGLDPEDQAAKVDLRAFFDWVDETKFQIDPAFLHALSVRFRQKTLAMRTDDRGQLSEDHVGTATLDPRERATLTKLITVMAIDGYGYDPQALRSPIPKQIEEAFLLRGLEITTNTIRKYLREGGQYLPGGLEQK